MIAILATVSSNSTADIAKAESHHGLIFAGYIALLFLTLLATYFVWRSGTAVTTAIRADADARIEAAKAVAEVARKDAALANERTTALAIKLEEESRKRAEAERALLELQNRIKGRRLTAEQRRQLVMTTKACP